MFRTAAAVVVILLGVAASAGAQAKPATPKPTQPSTSSSKPAQPIDRVQISVDGAFQSGGDDFGETISFVENAENGTFSTDYDVKSGPALNVSVGVAVFERAGLSQKRANGREQLGSTNHARLQRAGELLEYFESIWRQRIAQLDDVLLPKGR